MDKYEYKVRAEEIKALIAEGEFAEAVKIADTIDWHRVKSVMMLCTISDLYKINRRFQESKDILLLAYERHPGGRLIVYSLCELSIKMGEFVQAIEYYKEFVQIAPKDTGRYILQYKLYEAQDVSLEERIAVLEEFKKRDYREKWAYELAYLYHRVGLETKCVEECDEMILWFGEGRYVMKALELKMLHQPLSSAQQDKYLLMKQEMEQGITEPEPEKDEEPEQLPEEENNKIADFSEYIQPETKAEEEEFRVKTVDVGQYNTINLQRELAESMKEILEEEEHGPEDSSMGEITRSIVAPLLQETENIPPLESTGAAAEESSSEVKKVSELPKQMPELQTDTEEVFFEEDVKDVLSEDTKEINVRPLNEGGLGDTKELSPRKKTVYPSVQLPKTPVPVDSKPVETVVTAQGPHLMKTVRPSGFEQMLSQEYDGQISLVVPNKSGVEKQITGQMNITDIMAEWERMKRENEEKRRNDVRKRVQQHTGNMFSEFDEATKTGLLEQLEKAVVEAIMKESGEKQIDPGDITTEKLTDIVKSVENRKEEAINDAADAMPEESREIQEIEEPEEMQEITAVEQKTESSANADNVLIDTEIIDLANILLSSGEESGSPERKEPSQENNKVRALSEEEKELFGRFAHTRKTREQIIHAVDTMSMDSYSGNVIVTGEEGAGTLELAKSLVRMLQISDRNFSGKVAKISGAVLNKKGVQPTLSKLADGALIIENATEMSSSTADDLNKDLAKENNGLFVIMEGKKDEINIFLRKNFALMENFNARIDIESLDDQSLVEYAKQYAEEMEYSIDELGVLALHTRIADMQTSDHEVTVAEVRDLVDDAIYFADKKNPKHFFDILFGKRYDEEDMIILREKDFMHY